MRIIKKYKNKIINLQNKKMRIFLFLLQIHDFIYAYDPHFKID
jgi:hypothetical protein